MNNAETARRMSGNRQIPWAGMSLALIAMVVMVWAGISLLAVAVITGVWLFSLWVDALRPAPPPPPPKAV